MNSLLRCKTVDIMYISFFHNPFYDIPISLSFVLPFTFWYESILEWAIKALCSGATLALFIFRNKLCYFECSNKRTDKAKKHTAIKNKSMRFLSLVYLRACVNSSLLLFPLFPLLLPELFFHTETASYFGFIPFLSFSDHMQYATLCMLANWNRIRFVVFVFTAYHIAQINLP